MYGWIRDLHFALRTLARHPGFMVSAVVALALGIGANAAIFSVINSVILKPLPYQAPDRLVVITERNLGKGIETLNVSSADFQDWRVQTSSFSEIAAYKESSFNFRNGDQTDRLQGLQSSANLFQVLDIEPAIGRPFLPDEDEPGKTPVVIVSDRFWRESLHSDKGIVSHSIVLNDKSYTVIGIMPVGFQFPLDRENVDLWVPLVQGQANNARGSRQLQVIARLGPGVTLSRAQLDLEIVSRRLEARYPETNKGVGVSATSLKYDLTKSVRPALFMLMGAVILVLLTSCANVANLLLVRSARREKEMAVRTALGAKRRSLIRLLLAESMILATCSCVLGIAVAEVALRSIVLLKAGNVPRLNQVRIDTTVILFAILLSLAATMLFGLVPALITSAKNLNEIINEGSGRTSTGRRQSRTSHILVVVETVLGVVLLVSAALLLKSFLRLQNTNLGFEAGNTYTVRISLQSTNASGSDQWINVYRDILDKVQHLPQVSAAGITTTLPLSGDDIIFSVTRVDQGRQNLSDAPVANFDVISGSYFSAMGINLKEGRFFNENDNQASPKVVIINEALAKLLWAAERAIGKSLVVSYNDPVPRQVVGVVGNVRRSLSSPEVEGQLYLPYQQTPLPFATLVIRSSTRSPVVSALVRARVSEAGKDIPVYKAGTISELVSHALGESRFRTVLLGIFAALATILAVIGIYSVMAAYIADRQLDIGVRMALGATPRQIFNMVVGRGMLLAAIGEVLGLCIMLLVTPVLGRLFYGISQVDPFIAGAVLIGLGIAAFLACSLPALEAGNMNPYEVLRK
jgi:putative ABC transport system permease protein